MEKCNNCARRLNNLCKINSENYEQCMAVDYRYFKQMTNFDRIKSMSVEEMAERNVIELFNPDEPYYSVSDGTIFGLDDCEIGKMSGEEVRIIAIQHEIGWLNSESEE